MKRSDKDLIIKLNALPDQDRADLLEFLGGHNDTPADDTLSWDRLEASIALHQPPEKPQQH